MPAVDQWSRPADGLIFGVRPKSLRVSDQRRFQQAAVGQVLEQGRERRVEPGQEAVLQGDEVVLVRVPAAVGDGDEPDARLDQPPRQQAALAERVRP